MAYFYFDFKDKGRRGYDDLIRSFNKQFSGYFPKLPDTLNKLYSDHGNGKRQPGKDSLMATLKSMFDNFGNAYIIIDALDECPDRSKVLSVIKQILEWEIAGLHVLATSRTELDIEEELAPLTQYLVDAHSTLVDTDIRIYICQKLQTAPRLKKWPKNVQNEIESALMGGAHGM